MATATGLATVFGSGIESTYGTAVAITKRHAIVSEELRRAQEVLQSNAITGNLSMFRRAGIISRRSASGPVNLEITKQNMGRWLQLMTGSSTTPVQQAATTAYLQTHAAGALDRKLTLQKSLRDLSGVEVKAFTYEGCICTQWEMSINVDGIPTINLTIDAEDVQTTTASTALLALAEPAHNPFNWTEASLTLAGVPASKVLSMTATGTNSQDVDGYFLGGGGTKTEPTVGDFRGLSGSLTAEFADTATIYDRFTAYSAHPLVMSFTGAIIAATHNERFTITIPEVRFSGTTPTASGPGKVTIEGPFDAWFNGTNPTYTIEYMSTDTTV
jgi:Phage tail tube protein